MKSLQQFIKESMINEESISKKKKTVKNAIKAIQGKKTSIKNPIKTIGILTSDFPNSDERNAEYKNMSSAQKRRLNKQPAKDLRHSLKSGGFVWKDVQGKYDEEENPVMIFNIGLSALQSLAKRFEQPSFIFIVINDNETADYQYYEKNGTSYDKTKEEHTIELVDGDDDFFTKISNSFKFRIPFSFESCRSRLESLILENIEGKDPETYIWRTITSAPSTRYYTRHFLYRGKNLN